MTDKNSVWRDYCKWWDKSLFISRATFGFAISLIVGVFIHELFPNATVMAEIGVKVAVMLPSYFLMDHLVRKELATDDGRTDEDMVELTSILTSKAREIAAGKQNVDPDRVLRAVCHNCDNDIYSDDKLYTNSKNSCFCDICWEIERARD